MLSSESNVHLVTHHKNASADRCCNKVPHVVQKSAQVEASLEFCSTWNAAGSFALFFYHYYYCLGWKAVSGAHVSAEEQKQCGGWGWEKEKLCSECWGRKLENTLWFGFCSSVLLSPIETKAIEECIEVLTKAQWASKISISGHVSSSLTINPFNQHATDSAPVHPLIVTTYTCVAIGDSSQSPLKQHTRCLCIPSIQCK